MARLAEAAAAIVQSTKKTTPASRDQCFWCHGTDHVLEDCAARKEDDIRIIEEVLKMSRKEAEDIKNRASSGDEESGAAKLTSRRPRTRKVLVSDIESDTEL